jgi:hypothetical protein
MSERGMGRKTGSIYVFAAAQEHGARVGVRHKGGPMPIVAVIEQ